MSPSHAFDTGGRDHCPFMPVFGPPARQMVRGEGTLLWDSEGRRYLDFLSGIAVVSLGHANPVIAAAIAEQAHTLVHVSNFFANPVATEAAVAVVDLLADATGEQGQVFFTNSGAEANECAIKLARRAAGPGRYRVISAIGGFHGRTLATLAATGQPAKQEPFLPMPDGFDHVPYGDLAAVEAAIDPTTAAVLIESVQGEGGVVPAPEGYLTGLRAICDRHGLLLMVDEVQTGMARTGRWFGFEHAGVVPDVVTLAKALGNGMPIGACWARRDVAEAFRPGDHGSTYSGTALATSAVVAVISEMRAIDAPARATEFGALLGDRLARVPGVVAVRGAGLLLGAVLEPPLVASQVTRHALDRGLIVNPVINDTVRFAPPLTVSIAEIDEAVDIFAAALAAATAEAITPTEGTS